MSSSDISNVVPYPMTNPQFLEGLAGPEWGDIQCAYFSGNPQDPDNPCINWNVYPASTVIHVMEPHLNNYFCVSLPKPGAPAGRKQPSFGKMFVLVIDDVGKKVSAAKIEAILGPPSYILETSAGSSHWGWILEPITDHAWAQGMVQALYRAIGAGDNLVKLQTMVRLPCGTNGKYGSSCRLLRWAPNNRIRHSDWIEIERRIGAITPIAPPLDLDPQLPDPGEVEADTTLQALREHGDVLGNLRKTTMGYGFDVRCFNAAEHTDKRDAAVYVPISGIYKCLHGHCINLTGADLRAYADKTLREESGGLDSLARREFDDVDEATVRAITVGPAVMDIIIDIWEQKKPPAWPGGILPPEVENTLTALAASDGVDLGALGATMLTAASGAADKRALFKPYANSRWEVRPVLWTLLVAAPGQRKTAVLHHPLERLRRLNGDRMKAHMRAMAAWRARPQSDKQQPQPEVIALLAEDTTVEKLQDWLAANHRGMLYLRDELAALFDFGRYQSGSGSSERAFFLEANEGGPFTVARMSRVAFIPNCALALLGGIQPHRLAEFKGLENDGLLSRFATIVSLDVDDIDRDFTAADFTVISTMIDRLLTGGAFDTYRTDDAGESLIRETEHFARELANRPEIGIGLGGFLLKLHGVHARTALLLHLIDGGISEVIPADTVDRAGRYARFMAAHAEVFYAGLPGSADQITKAIASFLLRHPHRRITAGQLRRDIAPCRRLKSLKEIQDAVFTLVIGKWLEPETHAFYNQAWRVNPNIHKMFTARLFEETKRVECVKKAMNWMGRHRPKK